MYVISFPGYWHYDGEDYERSNMYWHNMGARLAFVVVFEVGSEKLDMFTHLICCIRLVYLH